MEDTTKNVLKIKHMIDVAQCLFGIHGFEKVSMNDIADELNMSKASLYYYFPDKENLCKAVLEREKTQFITEVSELVSSIKDADKMLKEYSLVRISYFNRFLNLSRLRQETYSTLRPVFREVLTIFKEKEKEMIVKILKKGLSEGIFFIDNPDETASLYLDLLKGLGVNIINTKMTMTMEQEEYDLLVRKTALFTEIFIKGLKAN